MPCVWTYAPLCLSVLTDLHPRHMHFLLQLAEPLRLDNPSTRGSPAFPSPPQKLHKAFKKDLLGPC